MWVLFFFLFCLKKRGENIWPIYGMRATSAALGERREVEWRTYGAKTGRVRVSKGGSESEPGSISLPYVPKTTRAHRRRRHDCYRKKTKQN